MIYADMGALKYLDFIDDTCDIFFDLIGCDGVEKLSRHDSEDETVSSMSLDTRRTSVPRLKNFTEVLANSFAKCR